MEVQPKQDTVKGPADWFTGDVWIDVVARGRESSHLNATSVPALAQPGTRTRVDRPSTSPRAEGWCNRAVIVS
jgi:hypothetical protein